MEARPFKLGQKHISTNPTYRHDCPTGIQIPYILLLRAAQVGDLYLLLHPLVHLWARILLDAKEQQIFALKTLQMLYRNYAKVGDDGCPLSLRVHIREMLDFLCYRGPLPDIMKGVQTQCLKRVAVLGLWEPGEALTFAYRRYLKDEASPFRD